MQDSLGFPSQVFKTWGSRLKASGLIACDGFGGSALAEVFRFRRSCCGLRVSALGETFLRWFFLGRYEWSYRSPNMGDKYSYE